MELGKHYFNKKQLIFCINSYTYFDNNLPTEKQKLPTGLL